MAVAYKSAIGEVRTYEGWERWAKEFYTALHSDDTRRDASIVRYIDILMPEDWFARISKVLRLEPVESINELNV